MRFLRRPKPEPAVRVTPWGIGAVILLVVAAVASWLAQPDPPEEEGEGETTKDRADSGDDPPPAFRPRGLRQSS